ncbi:MAG: tRNA (adenosine(37)-N6)-threonylcarbamoyltransferase complex dimerization subunit type 1 TsaB [Verrucomicrobiae bacterium]|nr:tRNA (adenosine(37)-N6)-threonylcarbamoyltransferase complex dimerization subunit type 1 TsaB [Verrucomicrobiae bacterium]MDW8311019.1 tRNA (adenosine(37)-N6)-threonylcarbamoyltransferase complex dimerization subunit type 1 TsaB [Verrucomicrobiales bacterium]
MRILALEFSSPQRGVAVLDAGPDGAVRAVGEAIEGGSGHAMRPFELVEGALREAGIEREQIEAIAVGLGPGSYTGVRAAIALAQGWQLARARSESEGGHPFGVGVVGVSSAECIAATAQESGLTGPVSVVVDAQRGEFYLARYELGASGWRETAPLRLVGRAEVQVRAQAGDWLIGPEVTRWFDSGRVVFPRAAVLARLALGRALCERADALEPIYLRATSFAKAPPPRW